MNERIRELAQELGMRDGRLVQLARDISHDGTLLDLEYMRREDALQLLLFLENRLKQQPVLA